jgi:uncharacterized protein (DUF1330 family)
MAMKTFVIAAETVNDESVFSQYRKAVPATLEAYGGRFVVHGGPLKVVEGDWPHPRLVVIIPVTRCRRGMVPLGGVSEDH